MASTHQDKLEDLNLTNEEIQKLTDAFKKDEFKKLFFEYAEEISNPENRALYEKEISQLENERGMDVKFIHPEPGYVLKTTFGGTKKVFINVCKNSNVEKPTSQKQVGEDGRQGLSWTLPHSFSPPREDVVKSGGHCQVFDFVVHPDTYRLAETNARFKKMVNDLAVDGIKRLFNVELDANNLKCLKMKYKGTPTPSVIRSKLPGAAPVEQDPEDVLNPYVHMNSETSEEKTKRLEEENLKQMKEKQEKESKTKITGRNNTKNDVDDNYTIPKYVIKHQSNVDMQDFVDAPDARTSTRPKMLIIEIDLPLLRSAAPIALDIFEKQVVLVSHEPAKYKLSINVPYPVDENLGSAKFDKAKRKLVVSLPVLPAETPKLPFNGDCFDNKVNESSECNVNQVNDHGDGSERMELGNEFEDVKENGKPLIEVISESVNNDEDDDDDENDVVPCPVQEPTRNNSFGISASAVAFILPDFQWHQDRESLTIIFATRMVKKDAVALEMLSSNSVSLKMVSVGDGGFPIYFACYFKFEDGNLFTENGCKVDVSCENVVLLLQKKEDSYGFWNCFQFGKDPEHLEHKQFETNENLMRQLESMDSEKYSGTPTNDDNGKKTVEVIRMDEEQIVVEIKDQDQEELEENEQPAKIVVVHERSLPKLHGILKQRTMSESSDDFSRGSLSADRQMSTTTCTDSDSEDSSESPLSSSGMSGIKKSVSFNEHIDKTLYQTNQSVSHMHSTLKNKRKRVRKREQKLEQSREKLERRRHRSSGSISMDSSDEANVKCLAAENSKRVEMNQRKAGNQSSVSGATVGLKSEVTNEDMATKAMKDSTGDACVTNQMVTTKTSDLNVILETKPAIDERDESHEYSVFKEVIETSCEIKANPTALETCEKPDADELHVDVREKSDEFVQEKPVDEEVSVVSNTENPLEGDKDGGDVGSTCKESVDNPVFNDLSPGGLVGLKENNCNSGALRTLSDSKLIEEIPNSASNNCFNLAKSNGNSDKGVDPEENGKENSAPVDDVAGRTSNTMLSWDEGKKSDVHKSNCAVQFTNSVMYDLDVD